MVPASIVHANTAHLHNSLTIVLHPSAPLPYPAGMMQRLILMLTLFLGWHAYGEPPRPQYAEIFKASVLSGTIGDTTVNLYLAPSPYIRDAAGDFIASATGTLDICVYEINLPMILGRILDAHNRGVKVRLAVPPSAKPSQYEETAFGFFKDLELHKVVRYTTPKSGLMHNKFMVADGLRIWTGSYNLTRNDTELNDNNAITFSNALLAAN